MTRRPACAIVSGSSDTVKSDVARSGSLMRRMESITKLAEPAAAASPDLWARTNDYAQERLAVTPICIVVAALPDVRWPT
jgi:hypothetical protein